MALFILTKVKIYYYKYEQELDDTLSGRLSFTMLSSASLFYATCNSVLKEGEDAVQIFCGSCGGGRKIQSSGENLNFPLSRSIYQGYL